MSAESAGTTEFNLVLRFDEAWRDWKKGNRESVPAIEEFVPADGPQRNLVLLDLVTVDLERRAGSGEEVHVEDYRSRFPDLEGIDGAICRLVRLEYDLRAEQGKGPSLDEYARRFPEHADQIKERRGGESTAAHQPAADTRVTSAGPPDQIDKYQVVRKLGEGTFGVVYLAFDQDLKRHVAIKLLKTHLPQAQTLLEEARKQVEVRHPHILSVLEARDNFIVYEYCGGGTLREMLAEKERLSLRDGTELIAKLADALQCAHEKDVYHLDVKPANILFGEGGIPYLSDFGLAVTDEEVGQLDAVRGTPGYMSPEQVLADGGGIHGGTDIYCLGAVFYEVLTGRKPFRADSYSKLLRRVERPKRPRPPRQIDPTIPKRLEAICLRAMSPDIDKRYSSAKDFGDSLRLWLRDIDNQPAVDSGETRGSRAYAVGAAVSIVTVAVVVAGAVLALRPWNSSEPAAETEAKVERLEVRASDPMPFWPSHDELNMPPKVPVRQVRFTMRNLTRYPVVIVMFGCRPENRNEETEWVDPFEAETSGWNSDVELAQGECVDRPILVGTGWYVFFVRRIDQAIWYPYRRSSVDVGKRNVCQSRHVLLDISEGNEKEVPYVWNFDESDEPFPDVRAESADGE